MQLLLVAAVLVTYCPSFSQAQEQSNSTIQDYSGSKLAFTNGSPMCMNVTIEASCVEHATDGGLRLKIGYLLDSINGHITAINDNTVHMCYPLSPQLIHCNNISRLDKHSYRIQNHTLMSGNQFHADLGDYYIDAGGNAYSCNETIYWTRDKPRCNYIKLTSGEYLLQENGSLYIKAADVMLDTPQFTRVNDEGSVNVCYPLSVSLLNCRHPSLKCVPPILYGCLPNMKLVYMRDSRILDLGDYYYVNDYKDAMVCNSGRLTGMTKILHYVYLMLYSTSAICLLMAFVHQCSVPKQTTHSRCLMGHIFSSFIFTIYLMTINYAWTTKGHSHVLCYLVFVTEYVSAVAATTWLNAEAFDVWCCFARLEASVHSRSRQLHKKHRFLCYSIYAWGMPIAICCTVLIVDASPGLQKILSIRPLIVDTCWFHNTTSAFVFYYGLLLVLLATNVVFFMLTLYNIRSASKDVELVTNQQTRKFLSICIKLFVVCGISRICEAIMWVLINYVPFPFWFVSHSTNSLQGIAIFVIVTKKCNYKKFIQDLFQHVNSKLGILDASSSECQENSTVDGIEYMHNACKP